MALFIGRLSATANPSLNPNPWWDYSFSYYSPSEAVARFQDYYRIDQSLFYWPASVIPTINHNFKMLNTEDTDTVLQNQLTFQVQLDVVLCLRFYSMVISIFQRLSEVISPLQLMSLTGRLLVAVTNGPNQFQDEFEKISRELTKGNDEVYAKIQGGMAEQVEQMKVTSQKLVDGRPLDELLPLSPEQESRWLGWFLGPLSKRITGFVLRVASKLLGKVSDLILLPLRIIAFVINVVAFII